MAELLQNIIKSGSLLSFAIHASSLIFGAIFGGALTITARRLHLATNSNDDLQPSADTFRLAPHRPITKSGLRARRSIRLSNCPFFIGLCIFLQESRSKRVLLNGGACGILLLGVSFTLPFSLALLSILWFTGFLLILSMIDYYTLRLPDALTQPLLWSGLLISVSGVGISPESAICGSVCGYMSLWGLYWLFRFFSGKEGVGYGDFKLLAAIGAWTGWEALPLVCTLAACSGIVFSIFWKKNGGAEKQIPFGPSLSAAGFLIYTSQKSEMLWLM